MKRPNIFELIFVFVFNALRYYRIFDIKTVKHNNCVRYNLNVDITVQLRTRFTRIDNVIFVSEF